MELINTKRMDYRPRVLHISTYPPRECGIATYTQALVQALEEANLLGSSQVVALNERGASYDYSREVIYQIEHYYLQSYQEAAEVVNRSRVNLVSLQHEFGIFGGQYGKFILQFLEVLTKPVVTTFHTVLPEPPPEIKLIVEKIERRSDRVIVLANCARNILIQQYSLPAEKLVVIPHGVPDVPILESGWVKRLLHLENRFILTTFGLINPGKGVEYVIKALPSLITEIPQLLYLVIGETHPEVRKRQGENYRQYLLDLVDELGLGNHVKFHNRFLRKQELIRYLQATDIYISPYVKSQQVTSGTLSMAVGCGKAIISTPYLYARELLAEGRGILCQFCSPESIANVIRELYKNREKRQEMERRSYEQGRQMIWPRVAERHLRFFYEVLESRRILPVKLNHLRTLTDDRGLLQYTFFTIPDRKEGYCTDDNARALILALKYYQRYRDNQILELARVYLSFLRYMQRENGKFHNFIDYHFNFLDEEGSEDSFGRALWACGYATASSISSDMIQAAREIFHRGLPWVDSLVHLRARSFVIMGLVYYYHLYPGAREMLEKAISLSDNLIETYRQVGQPDWRWFENRLTYDNARLPQSLYLIYQLTGKEHFLQVAEDTFNFLISQTLQRGKFVPVGNRGWYQKGGEYPEYDQQPIEACAMVEAAVTAFQVTGKEKYRRVAEKVFGWFLGKNLPQLTVYDPLTGGCFDGITPQGLNLNQGAESTLSYLIARLAMEELGPPESTSTFPGNKIQSPPDGISKEASKVAKSPTAPENK